MSRDHAPQLFHPSRPAERAALQELLRDEASAPYRLDRLRQQVAELLKSRMPEQRLAPAALLAAADQYIQAHGGDTCGCWVLYPWRRSLVRLLPEPEFVELRTSRNRYKITWDEQQRLARASIGIVGLSAGNAIATCLALERIGGSFRLADHDRMELSNMNRVWCGVTALGTNKAVLTAHQLYEIDPYLQIEVFEQGVDPDNVSRFMSGAAKLDLLIEECDDLYMKVRLREEARARGIAVVMETNDRGLLDVERFDLEPARPLLHGLLADVRSEELKGLDTEAKTPFVLRVLGGDMSPRLAASLIEIDKTVTGWPQLGSGNMLGGAVVTETARRILLGESTHSGRFRVDLEQLLAAEVANVPEPLEAEPALAPSGARQVISPNAAVGSHASREEIGLLVERASMAPSGGNDQPWRFTWQEGGPLRCYLDRAHSGSFLDYDCAASYLAHGAAAENALLAAGELGRAATLEPFPASDSPDLVFSVKLGELLSPRARDPLASFIETRTTNRRRGERRPLGAERVRDLEQAARERGAELSLVSEPEALAEIGEILGGVDRFRLFCEPLHAAMLSELRWSAAQAVATRDGIDVGTLELDALGMAGLTLLAKPKTAQFLRSLDKGARLENAARNAIASASAVGLIRIQGTDRHAYFQAGRALQRIWLTATRLGLAFQPMSVAPYLFLRLTRGAGEGFTAAERVTLGRLRERFGSIFQPRDGWAEPLLFRLTFAPAPSSRALRRPLAAILTET